MTRPPLIRQDVRRSPYWTGSKHGIRYTTPDGTSIDRPDEDGRPLLIAHLKETLGITQEEAELFADEGASLYAT